jgi:hypothetical protein
VIVDGDGDGDVNVAVGARGSALALGHVAVAVNVHDRDHDRDHDHDDDHDDCGRARASRRGLLAAHLEPAFDEQRPAQRRRLLLALGSEDHEDALDREVAGPAAALVDLERLAAEPEGSFGRLLHPGHEARANTGAHF